MNLLYPDFSRDERRLLSMACVEEIRYWKRYRVTDFILSKDGKGLDRSNTPPYHPGPALFNKIAEESKKTFIPKYKRLFDKIKDDEKEYDADDIHWLKIMCQEIIPQIKRHLVVKLQVDGSVSEKHALGIMKISIETAQKLWIEDYEKLAERLSKMDTIPGDGMKDGPQAFRLVRDGTIGSDEISK